MGGAYLLATDDATAVAWNPAALVNAKRFTLPAEISGRTNFNVQDVKDLVDSLKDIRDQIGPSPNLQVLAKAILWRCTWFCFRPSSQNQIHP